jgi:GT2 family glycosyltransferase
MDMLPKTTIYATVYNNGSIVEFSLNSIIKQFNNFQKSFNFTIVDNYSNDGTWGVLQKFAKNYKNIKLIREHCSMGEGRAIAVNSIKTNYMFYVDLDTIYLPEFSKIIKYLIKNYKINSLMQFGFCDRKTIDKIGNWADLIHAEDTEFGARALSKGVKIYELPVFVSKNQIVKGNRDKRYELNKFKLFKRWYTVSNNFIDGRGITSSRELKRRYSGLRYFIMLFILYKRKLLHQKIRAYSNELSNLDFITKNRVFLNPTKFGISKRFWIFSFPTKFIKPEYISNGLNKLFEYGFNRIKLLDNGILVVYTDKTSKELLKYYLTFLSNY